MMWRFVLESFFSPGHRQLMCWALKYTSKKKKSERRAQRCEKELYNQKNDHVVRWSVTVIQYLNWNLTSLYYSLPQKVILLLLLCKVLPPKLVACVCVRGFCMGCDTELIIISLSPSLSPGTWTLSPLLLCKRRDHAVGQNVVAVHHAGPFGPGTAHIAHWAPLCPSGFPLLQR